MSARIIPDAVRARQTEASDPAISAFVAANAGSGKTHVLAQRVIRLLLDGTEPEKILCITFTKAAAANMANRVFDELRKWIALDDASLDEAMRKIGVKGIDPARRARARRLFAEALETPGGLKVQTIHAFCTRLLHQFPFEANVAARFTVMDERAENELLDRTSLAVLLDATAAPEGLLGRALSTALSAAGDTTFREIVRDAIGERDKLKAWIEQAGSVEAALQQLSRALGISETDTVERVDEDIVNGPLLPATKWSAIAKMLRQGSKSDCEQATHLEAGAVAAGPARIEEYFKIFFTAKLEPRKRLVTKAIEEIDPELAARFLAEQERLAALLDRRRAVQCRNRTAALAAIASEVIKRYQAEKGLRGLLDYDDLIEKTFAMLAGNTPSWVHYKLDLGIDHVLIDEAQDTSPRQWEIVSRLVSEFSSGAGARADVKRTIFAVGDEKQSIFSFQGAAPREFARMHRAFETAFKAAEREWRNITLQHSFRSGANVLDAVDTVFAGERIFVSVTSDAGGIPPHEALPDAAPGLVEIWDPIEPEDKREIEAWDAPFDELSETSPQAQLAQKIARTVRAWTARGTNAGEVLVLVRQRGPLFEAIIRALKQEGVAVAGADRLKLTGHIAVMDLMALADALLLPHDDLALAVALKSPLFGLDDDRLFKLAWARKGTLRNALAAKADGDPAFASAKARLDRCAAAMREKSPFAFYAFLLGPEGGRAAMLARLGHEAADALDEFLEFALDYERRETPSLQGFLAWLRAAETEIKRDMDIARDEVRVMTVHGAKGLEAKNVILADTSTPPHGAHPPRLISLPVFGAAPGTPDLLVWAGAKNTDAPAVAVARAATLVEAEHEYRRLLYVAMTRAAERLVVCCATGQRKKPDGCWYNLVRDALNDELVEEPADDGAGTVWRYRRTPIPPLAAMPAAQQQASIEIPAWLKTSAPAMPRPMATITPSTAFEGAVARRAAAKTPPENLNLALARGRLIHRLMQSLPDIAPHLRAEAGRRYLARAGNQFADSDRDAFLAEVLGVLDEPRFAPLFAPGSRAEVPIVGRIARPGRAPLAVSGQIDRLAVTAEAVLIADYKTDRPPPRQPKDAPEYVTQLALYRAVLAKMYPDRPIRAALVWTNGPNLMELSADILDEMLARFQAEWNPVSRPESAPT